MKKINFLLLLLLPFLGFAQAFQEEISTETINGEQVTVIRTTAKKAKSKPVATTAPRQAATTSTPPPLPGTGCTTPSPDYSKVMSTSRVNELIGARLMPATYCVNVMFHVIRFSDGSDGATEAEVMDQVDNFLIPNFASADISFILEGVNFIDDDAAATTADYLATTSGTLYPVHGSTDRLDIFVYPSSLGDLPGNAFAIPNDFLAVTELRFGTSQNLSHEVGHTLGLIHTHETYGQVCPSTFIEKIDGTDCATGGDLCCDTAADPQLGGGNFNSGTCVYSGTEVDCNGDSPYTPPTNNFMSYAWSCRGMFTACQIDRMQAELMGGNVGPDMLGNCLDCELNVSCALVNNETISCRVDLPPVNSDLPLILESCGDVTISTLTVIPGNSGCPGDEVAITRTYTIEDEEGNIDQCMQTFTVVSNVAPTISCPAGGVVECAADIVVSVSDATATAECGTPSISLSGPVINGTPDCPATTYTYTYTVTDFCNRMASCTQVFTIANDPPTIICPANMVVECAADIVVSADNAITTTSCTLGSNVVLSGPVIVGDPDCPGTTHTYTYTLTDDCGRTASCTQVFTIQNDPPTITCPADMTVECSADIVVDPADAVVVTSCTLGSTTVLSGPVQVGQTDCPGTTYTYTYTATDDCGRVVSCQQVFTIQNLAPIIVCPADEVVTCFEDIVADPTNLMVTTACGMDFFAYVKQPLITGGIPGCDGTVYTYIYKVTDACGRVSECQQQFLIQNDAPTVTVPAGGTVDCFADILVSPNDATVVADCEGDFVINVLGPVISGPANCPGTTYTYTYRVKDFCNRIVETDRVFTIGNNAAPVITSIIETQTTTCLAGVNPNENFITYETACGDDATVNIAGPQIIGSMDCPGTRYRYTYTVTDACGRNSAPVVLDYVVQNDGPIFAGCEEDQWLQFNCEDYGGEEGTIAVIQAYIASVSATSACGNDLTVFNNFNSNNINTCINNGINTITFRATDNCGRTSFCTTTYVVVDTEAPVIFDDAQDHWEICNYDSPHRFDDWVDNHGGADAYDECSGSNVFWSTMPSNPSFDCDGAMGVTSVTVTFIARDNCGNTSSTTATFNAFMGGGDLGDHTPELELGVDESASMALYQNRPNPFKSETLISFNLPEASEATLTIYDINGRLLKVVQNNFEAGYNEVSVNRSELGASGVVYYRLRTDKEAVTKTMLIMD